MQRSSIDDRISLSSAAILGIRRVNENCGRYSMGDTMSTEEKLSLRIERLAGSFKFIGWWFLFIGSIVCIQPVYVLFHPDATISVNGVPANDFATKLGVTAFA